MTGSLASTRALDADMVAAFQAAGMGDAGSYTDSVVTALAVDVLIDRGVQQYGNFGQVTGTQTQVGFQKGQVTPHVGGVLVIGAETFTLDRRADGDESLEWWSVKT